MYKAKRAKLEHVARKQATCGIEDMEPARAATLQRNPKCAAVKETDLYAKGISVFTSEFLQTANLSLTTLQMVTDKCALKPADNPFDLRKKLNRKKLVKQLQDELRHSLSHNKPAEAMSVQHQETAVVCEQLQAEKPDKPKSPLRHETPELCEQLEAQKSAEPIPPLCQEASELCEQFEIQKLPEKMASSYQETPELCEQFETKKSDKPMPPLYQETPQFKAKKTDEPTPPLYQKKPKLWKQFKETNEESDDDKVVYILCSIFPDENKAAGGAVCPVPQPTTSMAKQGTKRRHKATKLPSTSGAPQSKKKRAGLRSALIELMQADDSQ